MSRVKWIKDSFIAGLIGGTVSLILFYYFFSAMRIMVMNISGNQYILRPPAVQLFTMMINIIFFRILMINLNKEQTAKGFLFITVIVTLIYFFIFFRLNK